jgi:hypothetical protein
MWMLFPEKEEYRKWFHGAGAGFDDVRLAPDDRTTQAVSDGN